MSGSRHRETRFFRGACWTTVARQPADVPNPRGVRLTHISVILLLYSATFMHADSCRVFLSSHDWNVSLRLASRNEENRIKEGKKKTYLTELSDAESTT